MSLILIVEDNDKNLKLVRDVLQVKGYQTIEAGTAEDGIELAREHKPDLVLMDIQLPGMNGIEALKVLRADASTARIPVIAVTASVMQQDRNLITEAGSTATSASRSTSRNFSSSDAVRSDMSEPGEARSRACRRAMSAADTRRIACCDRWEAGMSDRRKCSSSTTLRTT